MLEPRATTEKQGERPINMPTGRRKLIAQGLAPPVSEPKGRLPKHADSRNARNPRDRRLYIERLAHAERSSDSV
ncbi:hypothetical protein MTO96_003685 [Rhipicephalus appendiculatus]